MKRTFYTCILLCLVFQSFSKNNLKNSIKQFTGLSKEQQMHFTAGLTGDTTLHVYCNSAGLSTANGYINRIVINSIDNTSGNNGGYANFTSQSTSVTRGNTYTLKVQAGFRGPNRVERWTVYIDCNSDGDFNDEGEKIGSALTHTAALAGRAFQIPSTAKTGNTRMRVQMHYNSGITNPCGKFILGEVEDYTLNIAATPGDPGDPGDDPDGLFPGGISVSPNPVVSSSVQLSYTLAKAGNISFQLTDVNGLVHGNYKAGIQMKGANNYRINDISSMRNGYYYVSVQQDGKTIGKVTLLIKH